MIWATVSSQSCFSWLYRASPSLVAKNIINLILVLTIQWCPCRVISYGVGRGCLLWPMCSLGKTLLAICLLLQVSLDFLLLHSSPLWWKGHLFVVLVLEGLVGLHQFSLVQFSSVQSLSHVQLFVTPWTTACQASLSITNSQSLPKLMSIESVMPSNHLILCHPLLLLPSISPSIRVFQLS